MTRKERTMSERTKLGDLADPDGPDCPHCQVPTYLFCTIGEVEVYWCDFCDYEVRIGPSHSRRKA